MSNGLFLRQLTGMSIWIKPIQHWCRWTSTCFLLTLYNSLKNFLSGISNAIFFTSSFFNAFSRKNGFLGRALSTRSTPSFVFLCQDAAFFSFILVLFSKRSQRPDGNHRLKSSGQELKSTEEFTGKIQGHSHYLWPVRSTFWMSSCREPTCPLFWLEQELHVEVEQVKYFKIQLISVVFRWNARSHSRHPLHDHTDGRRVAELSLDSKYSNEKGSEQLTTKFQTIHS